MLRNRKEQRVTTMTVLDETSIRSMTATLCAKYAHRRCTPAVTRRIVESWNQNNLLHIISEVATVFGVSMLHVRVTFGAFYLFTSPEEARALAKVSVMPPPSQSHLMFRPSEQEISRLGLAGFAFVTAHEMAHIRLHTDIHPLRMSEPATDILALIMGFDTAFEALMYDAVGQLGYIPKKHIPYTLAEIRERVKTLYVPSSVA